MNEVILGRAHDFVSLRIRAKEFPAEVDNDDAQWLRVHIVVVVGGMRASVPDATLTVGEVTGLLEDCEALIRGSQRIARLGSLEEWIELVIEMNSRGGLEVRGRVQDAPRNVLDFTLEGLDQTFLPPLVDALNTALSPYV